MKPQFCKEFKEKKRKLEYIYQKYEGLDWKRKLGNRLKASSLKILIFKFGKENGSLYYKELQKIHSVKNTLEGNIARYGIELGTQKYYEKNKKLSVSIESLRANGFSEEEIKNVKKKHKEKSDSRSYDAIVNRHGEKNAQEIYEKRRLASNTRSVDFWLNKGISLEDAMLKVNKIQSRGILWFINKYPNLTEEEIKKKYVDYQKKKGKTHEELILKYGIDKANEILDSKRITTEKLIEKYGKDKAHEIIISRLHKFAGNSKIQLEFSEKLYYSLPLDYQKKFYGDPITRSYFINLNESEKQKLPQKIIIPDILIDNTIIEFDGEYWHSLTELKDSIKDEIYRNRGFEVIRVAEKTYKENKERTIQNVIKKILKNESYKNTQN